MAARKTDVGLPHIRRNPLADQAYVTLREAIVTGALSPGQRLVERRLSQEMGASRTPLREALIRLQHEGLLSSSPTGGLHVSSMNVREAAEIYAIRMALEGYAGRLAAERADSRLAAGLRAIVEEEYDLLAPIELRRLEELNNGFHRMLYSGSAMQRLADLIETYREHALHYRIYEVYEPHEVRRGIDQHEEILRAIEGGDGELAERLVRNHISTSAEIVLARRFGEHAEER